jgi:hypothetical protein
MVRELIEGFQTPIEFEDKISNLASLNCQGEEYIF